MTVRKQRDDVAEVSKVFPPGTRLRCTSNGKTYQIGTQTGSRFWTMCENDAQRGTVEAHVILRHFQKLDKAA